MGTRAIVRIMEKTETGLEENIVIYSQYDGYPEFFGKGLAEFSADFFIVNGLGESKVKIANGAGCFAAQLVCHLKKKPGNIYIYPSFSDLSGLDYTYDLILNAGKPVEIKSYEIGEAEDETTEKEIFSGTCKEFLVWLNKDKVAK